MGLLLSSLAGCKFPYPPDIPDDDVGVSDASRDGTGDEPTDARVRAHPLVADHQAADIVIGQPDFTSRGNRPFGPQFVSGGRLSGNADRLWLSDYGMTRVLLYRPFPVSNDPVPAMALGHPNFTDYLPGQSPASSFSFNAGVVDTGQRLLVVDHDLRRVLIWNAIPSTGTEPASLVLGQAAFDSIVPGNGASQLAEPTALWSDGVRVVVADTENNRVLIWRTFPTQNGQPADVVLGQVGFGHGESPASPTASSMKLPGAVTSDGTRLAIADVGHGRVLVWNQFPDTNNAPANLAIGQRDLNSAVLTQPGDPHGFATIAGLALVDGAIFVGDTGNARVLVFDPVPSQSIADVSRAQQALGQPNPTVVNLNQSPTERSLRNPDGLALVNGFLFVGDGGNNRALRYRLDLD